MFTEIAFEETRVEQEKKEENIRDSSQSQGFTVFDVLYRNHSAYYNRNNDAK